MYFYLLLIILLMLTGSMAAGGQTLQGGVEDDVDVRDVVLPEQSCQTMTIQAQVDDSVRPITFNGTLDRLTAHEEQTPLQGNVNGELSACGFGYFTDYRLRVVDRNCDIYGKVQLGDTILSINAEDPKVFVALRHNYRNDSVPCRVEVQHQNGRHEFLLCRRKPVASFSQSFRNGMLSPQ